MKQLYDEINSNGEIVKSNIVLVVGLSLPEGHKWVPHTLTLEEAKREASSKILHARETACVRPVNAINHTWQADNASQALLTRAILLSQLGVTPVPPSWRSLDNQDVYVTLDDLKAIASAIALQVQTAYSLSWQQKALVESANSVEEVLCLI